MKRLKRRLLRWYHRHILGHQGPVWFALSDREEASITHCSVCNCWVVRPTTRGTLSG